MNTDATSLARQLSRECPASLFIEVQVSQLPLLYGLGWSVFRHRDPRLGYV